MEKVLKARNNFFSTTEKLFLSIGHNEDYCHVTCWLLAKQKKSVRSLGDISWSYMGDTSLCLTGKIYKTEFP